MSPGLLSQRSCQVLEPTPPTTPDATKLRVRSSKIAHRGSRVWSDVRGAIKDLGSSRSGRCPSASVRPPRFVPADGSPAAEVSESSTVLARNPSESARAKGKDVTRKHAAVPPPRKTKKVATIDWLNGLSVHSGFDSGTTVMP